MESKHHLIHLWAKVDIPPHPHECFPFMFSWSFSCSCLRTHLGLKKKINLCVTAFTRADLCASRWKKLSNDATGGRVKAAEAWLTVWGSFGVSGCDIFSFWAVKSEALEAVASGFVCSPPPPPSLIMSSLHCFIIICLFGLNCSQLKPPYTSCKELQFFQSFFQRKVRMWEQIWALCHWCVLVF